MAAGGQHNQTQQIRHDIIDGRSTQGYGATGFETFHDGIDIVLPAVEGGGRSPIHAPISGTIVASGWDPATLADPHKGYGRRIIIQNGTGWTVLMGHEADQSKFSSGGEYDTQWQTGEQVWAGDVIGHMGSTGASTGPHVHYRIHDPQGRSVDPSLGLPPVAHRDDRLNANLFYAFYHDMGFGAGDNEGLQKWNQQAPAPGYSDGPILGPPLGPNNGVADPTPPPCPPGTDCGPQPIPIPIGTEGCDKGPTIVPDPVSGLCPQGYTMAGYVCVCATNTTGGGGLLGDVSTWIAAAGVALVGIVFIAAGLVALSKEGPVNAVTAPLAAGGRSIIKTGAKVGALAA